MNKLTLCNPRMVVRIVEITDTRTWWQRSILSKIDPRVTAIMVVYGALCGAAIGALAQ